MGKPTPLQQLAEDYVRLFVTHEVVPEKWRSSCHDLTRRLHYAQHGIHLTPTQMQAWFFLLLLEGGGGYIQCLKGLSARERCLFLMSAVADGLLRWDCPYEDSYWNDHELDSNLQNRSREWVGTRLVVPLVTRYVERYSRKYRDLAPVRSKKKHYLPSI